MTLQEFLSLCPPEMRLGQHFVCSYWKGCDEDSQTLFQLDGDDARWFILGFCCKVHWDMANLPEPRRYWEE
jgi:hypothetical protein